jgi:hypothetical protein
MRTISRIIAAAAAAALSASMCCCGNKKKADSSDTKETAESTSAETTTDDAKGTSDTETTTASSDGSKETTVTSADTTTTAQTETTTAAVTEKPVETTKKPDDAPQKGFGSAIEAANAYYKAYLTSDADAVYDMFCSEEIEGYHAYLGTTELLEGQNAQVVFKRSNVINAIRQSIKNIHDIMAEKSDVPADKWTTSMNEELLKPIGENDLNDFNKTLGTQFKNAVDCGIVYYKDGSDEHDFVGNGCAFLELDGRWYLSYTTLLRSELFTYMDVF